MLAVNSVKKLISPPSTILEHCNATDFSCITKNSIASYTETVATPGPYLRSAYNL